ncbi:PIR protein, putative [Plasmodium sp.]|nr:PIR protein, putative [Plasmodium sp.]
MIYYNIKFIFFSIILGILNLIYNNDYSQLYKNINYKVIVELPNNFRTLGELLCEPLTNHTHENNILSEYGNTKETKYKKNIYTKDPTKRNPPIREVTEKVNNSTINSNKYNKEKYNQEKEAKSNRSSRSIKYLEMQRKLYNNFYAKPGTDFKNFSDISNDKSCECENKKKSYNKVNDKYLENLKECCVGDVGACTISSGDIVCGKISAAAAGTGAACVTDAVVKAVAYGVIKVTGVAVVKSSTIASCTSVVAVSFCSIAIIAIIAVLIIFYAWLPKRRKNS